MSKYVLPAMTPAYVMLSSDYSAQEPRIVAYVSADKNLIKSFQEGKDVYASVASLAFGVPYEACLEFHPETHEYQPEGKKRRSESKVIVLGICYGRSVPSIAEQLYGKDESMSDEEKTKNAQKVYDSVLNAFPGLRAAMINAQKQARTCGYTETILGRRRHLPDMQLPEFEFKAASGYVNPDIDPLDISTLESKNEIPDRIVQQLTKELKSYKYPGQVYRRIRELKDQNIIVVNNRQRIADASRQTLNCVDIETEILTLDGWKPYNEVKVGDKILSFDVENKVVTSDNVEAVHIYEEDSEVICFNAPTFSSVSTPQHRWVCNGSSENKFKFITSEHIEADEAASFSVLQVWDNNLQSRCELSKEQLISTKNLTFEFVSMLSQHQAEILLQSIIADVKTTDEHHNVIFTCSSKAECDIFQYLAFIAGYVTSCYMEFEQYTICILANREVQIYSHHKSRKIVDKVWCVTTKNGTWIARRDGKVYITGNSIIQGEQYCPNLSNSITQRCAA